MAITSGSMPNANDVRNLFNAAGCVSIGKMGKIRIPIIINNTSGVRSVKLWVYGLKTAAYDEFPNFSAQPHKHLIVSDTNVTEQYNEDGPAQGGEWSGPNQRYGVLLEKGSSATAKFAVDDQGRFIADAANVPRCVSILIDGTMHTATIGNPNSKTEYYLGTNDAINATEYSLQGTGAGSTTGTIVTLNPTDGFLDAVTLQQKCNSKNTTSNSALMTFNYTDATNSTTAGQTADEESWTYTKRYVFINPTPAKQVATVNVKLQINAGNTDWIYAKNIVYGAFWGKDGTTEWDTGELDLTAVISWTAGIHYLEFLETGGKGGTIAYAIKVEGW